MEFSTNTLEICFEGTAVVQLFVLVRLYRVSGCTLSI